MESSLIQAGLREQGCQAAWGQEVARVRGRSIAFQCRAWTFPGHSEAKLRDGPWKAMETLIPTVRVLPRAGLLKV